MLDTDSRPDFLVIGAMKSATSTLHAQLARQPGFTMADPKEPNFFSDDMIYALGGEWYANLFRDAPYGTIRGESSTHYSKLPTYPRTVERIAAALPRVKRIDVMRHPIDRLISHYRHERNVGALDAGIEEAVDVDPTLIDYGRYSYQLARYLESFGPENILPIFFDRLIPNSAEQFERIGRFLGLSRRLTWNPTLKPQNVTSQRLRRSPPREAFVTSPLLTPIRQRLFPKVLAAPIEGFLRENAEIPEIPPSLMERLVNTFDADLDRLSEWFGITLDCENFSKVTTERTRE